MSQAWFLFKATTNEQLGPMAFDEFRAAVSQLSPSEVRASFAWMTGWPDWRALEDVASEMKNLKVKLPPSPPKMKAGPGTASTSKSTSAKHSGSERRQHERYEADMSAVILSKGKVYKTKTENISAGGIRIKEGVPADLAEDASVIITKGDKHLKARVKEVEGKKNAFEFDDVKTQSRMILKDWLEHLSETKKRSA